MNESSSLRLCGKQRMTFLNWYILPALAAVAIPILIHLLNRRRARVVDWGAMAFLLASLAARSKRILVEEIILLALRCLVMVLAVLAVARPFLPSRPSATWILLLPCVVLAAAAFSLAAAVRLGQRLRRALLVAGAVLLALPVAAAGFEHVYQQSRWSFGGGRQDVAIVIDASGSMSLNCEGRTNFERAVDEARAVLAACPRGDGVAVIVAGASPQAIVSRPTTDRHEVETALAGATVGGGTMRVGPALQLASAVLAEGANPARKIVLITDGQGAGWDVRSEAAWRQVGMSMRAHPLPPQVVVRVLAAPKAFRNLAVTDLKFDRRIIGTDRPVEAAVRVENTGTEAAAGQVVRLLVDGRAAGEARLERLGPNAAETVLFRVRLEHAGRHVVTASLAEADDMPVDDVAERVVDVLSELGVLIVDGAPSKTALSGAADYLAIALAPPQGALAALEGSASCVVHPRTVAASDIAAERDLDRYAAVILADVPLLPKAAADELAAYVRRGGGLLVAAGRHASAAFYNGWLDEAGQAVLGGRLVKLRSGGAEPPALAPESLTHPAVAKLAEERNSDAARATFGTYWQIEAGDGQAVAARLAGGEPLLLERRLGAGRVMLAGSGLHTSGTNLPVLKCFVPLVHELTYHLAAPASATANVAAGADVVIELPAQKARVQEVSTAPGKTQPPAGGGRLLDGTKTTATSTTSAPAVKGTYAKGDEVVVIAPQGRRQLATVIQDGESLRLQLGEARQGGVYRLMLKSDAAARFAPLLDGNAVPVGVVTPPGESSMAMLTDEDLAAARGSLMETAGEGAEAGKVLARVETTAELAAAVAGGVPGKELWQYVAMALLAILLAEIVLTRHIAARRRSGEAEPVAFGRQAGEAPTLRKRRTMASAR